MILDKSSFFLLGIKGVAMANIAILLQQMGKTVTGVDVKDTFITDTSLSNHSIKYSYNFLDETSLLQSDVFVYSAAHGGIQNTLTKKALSSGKLVVSQAQLLAELLQSHTTSIAVAGCHGKTTTSSLLAWALEQLDQNPSYLVGAPSYQGTGGAKFGRQDFFVLEADEYAVCPPGDLRPKLLFYHPTYSLCLNIDYDHPDVYISIEDTKKTFTQFFMQSRNLVLCGDDVVLASLIPQLPHSSLTTYGMRVKNDYYVSRIKVGSDTSFSVFHQGKELGTIKTALFGSKNVLNVLGVVVTLLKLGFSFIDIQKAVHLFKGPKRRLELIWSDDESYVYDDYGHHPVEIEATLDALKNRHPNKKIYMIFQPHTFSRTKALQDGFISVFHKADSTYLAPIFVSAREAAVKPEFDSVGLAHLADTQFVLGFNSVGSLLNKFEKSYVPGNIILTIGAGDVYKLKDDIIQILITKKRTK